MPEKEYSIDGKQEERSWKSIAIALVVILVICALISVGVVFLSPKHKSGSNNNGYTGSKINLTEYLQGTFYGKGTGAHWISPGKMVFNSLSNGSIMLLTVNGNSVTTSELLQKSAFNDLHSTGRKVSPDGRYIAFSNNRTKLYRHSGFSMFTIIDTQTPTNMFRVIPPNGFENATLRVFSWNPVPGANSFVYVYNNNVYFQPSVFNNSGTFQVSSSATKDGFIYNGVPDWLYEEEILSTESAIWWSRDGKYLAYAQFNDTGVPLIQYPLYKDNELYPVINKIPYSKCGQIIPTVTLMLWSTQTKGAPIELKPPSDVQNLNEYYLFMVSWLHPNFTSKSDLPLVVTWANRRQNITYTTICSMSQQKCILDYTQYFSWISPSYNLWGMPTDFGVQYSASRNQYFMLLPQASTGNVPKNVYNGIASLAMNMNGTSRKYAVQSGNFDVASIVGYNNKRKELYFIAAGPLPRNRHFYKVSTNNTQITQEPQCITCAMEESKQCATVSVSFDTDGDTYLLSCNGPGRPRQWLKKMSTGNTRTTSRCGILVMLMNNNTELGATLATKALPVVFYTNVTLHASGSPYTVKVKLEMPPGTSLSTTTQYPMIVAVYGGPGSQSVLSNYGIGFNQYLVSYRRIIIASLDGRGAGGRGWANKAPMFHKFGTVEIQDQLNAAMQLQQRYSFIDKTKTGVWGWSYGGFSTAHIIVADTGKFFTCAASVAPVTDFRYYDAAYTERYMGLPEYNTQGYAASSVNHNATSFMNRNYLLAHGTGDDNVHFQNSAMLVKALTKANVQFKLMIYPNQQHSITGDRPHIWTFIDNHFQSCFQKNTSRTNSDL